MAADVVERAELAVATAQDHHALADDGCDEVLAAVGRLLRSTDADPVRAEPVLALEIEDRLVMEDARRKEASSLERTPDGFQLRRGQEGRSDPRNRRSHGRIVTRPISNASGVPSRGPAVPWRATHRYAPAN